LKKDIKSFKYTELKKEVLKQGLKSYRAWQIARWVWNKGVDSFEKMTDIKKEVREKLSKKYRISKLTLTKRMDTPDAVKFRFKLEDGKEIESVYMVDGERKTVCVSTQVGCALGCRFCRTGYHGFVRNLKFYEIVSQVLEISKIFKRPTNVVYMGMGEPFLNYEEVISSVELLNAPYSLNIGARKITLSTVGIIEGIEKLIDFPLQVKLAVSLNAPDQQKRAFLMPIAKKYPLGKLMEAVKKYTEKRKKRVTFEYVLIKGINDSIQDAKNLVKLLRDIPCKINLIPYNPFPEAPFQPPSIKRIERFQRVLLENYFTAPIRKSRGREILAGCGQLA